MLKKLLVVAAMSAATLSAFAVDLSDVKARIPLKDGSTLYIFKDGKMGMEDKAGRPSFMESGQIMETKDGKKFIMKGNEIYRVEEVTGEWMHSGGP